MDETPHTDAHRISFVKAFFVGVGDVILSFLLPIPCIMIPLLILIKLGLNTGQMTGVASIIPLMFAWWMIPLVGLVYAAFRISHQRYVFWTTTTIAIAYSAFIVGAVLWSIWR